MSSLDEIRHYTEFPRVLVLVFIRYNDRRSLSRTRCLLTPPPPPAFTRSLDSKRTSGTIVFTSLACILLAFLLAFEGLSFLFYFILHVCHYKSTNTIYNYTTMMSHKDYINISHKYYDGWNDHTEIKSPITGFHKVH